MERTPRDAPAPRDEKADTDDRREEPTLKPPRVRIGESREQLQRRREWFKRRTGSGE